MAFDRDFELASRALGATQGAAAAWVERFQSEIAFARAFKDIFPDKKSAWEKLILKAVKHVSDAPAEAIVQAIKEAEEILAPIGTVAKEYTIYCAGHAHIDMNWMWPWPETVNVTHDTFLTIDRLMDEFPEFHFSQSQASVYIAMEQYCPQIFEMVKKRVKEGRWEVTASTWVEGDKNIVSGESLCRHLLYTRQYFKEKFGFKPEKVKIDWSPDTFGHAHTVPSILSRGGVSRYYHMRTGPGPKMYKWRSPDGSEILVFNDQDWHGYNGPIHPGMAVTMCGFVKETGLKVFLEMYGVGDHGGGPTRKDLRKRREMESWPIFPVFKLSTVDAFFTEVEKANPSLPVIDKDLNFIFEGCYTSQSNIKKANRVSEIILPEAETVALVTGADYPKDLITRAWRWALFNHFHDILPGSGVKATYEYAQGLFQEIQATASAIRTASLRKLASEVDTASVVGSDSLLGDGLGNGLGAGVGDPGIPGGVTAYNQGAESGEPVLIYNQKAWPRSDVVYAKVWNKSMQDDRVIVRDPSGKTVKGQVVGRGGYWGHDFVTIAFPVKNVPATGYRVYAIDQEASAVESKGASITDLIGSLYGCEYFNLGSTGVMENEYLKVRVDPSSGAIDSIVDKETGFDYIPEGDLAGLLEVYQEAPHGMSAWIIGQSPTVERLVDGARLEVIQRGPHRVAVKSHRTYNNSSITLEIGLSAGSRMVDFKLNTRWTEIGTPQTGVPMLKVAFPVNVTDGVATYEIPFGSQVREQSGQEIPALKWADLSGKGDKAEYGVTLVNDSKYGHSCKDNTLRLTLLRSSYDPDPLPEVADHEIRFGLNLHKGRLNVVEAIRLGEEFNSPLAVASATVQKGKLPAEASCAEVLTPNVFISTIKKAESSNAVVIRMFEAEGKATTAKIKLAGIVKPDAKVVETDVLEQPLEKSSAKLSGGVLTVKVPAFGQATVKIG